MSVTVMDVFRDLGIEPDKKVSWSVGAAARDIYEARVGDLPPKRLRRKTSGAGSHCFATYPEWMRGDIERLIRAHQTQKTKQPAFDFETMGGGR